MTREEKNKKTELDLEKKESQSTSEEVPKTSSFKKIIILIFLIGLSLLAYTRYVGTSGLIIKDYPITSDSLPDNFDGLKIIQFSDVHYDSIINQNKLASIVETINNEKPDIIVFTGDLYDESLTITDDVKNELITTLSNLNAPLGKYAVSGNHDYSSDQYQNIITASGFTYLNSNSKLIYNNGKEPIEIVGYPSYLKDQPNYEYELSSYYKIALIHEPDAINSLEDKNINIAFAGHSHGGQVRFPFIGATYTPEGAKKYYNEHYTVNNTELYVNYGLGTVLLRLRYFDHPSINLYRFYSTKNTSQS